MNRNRMPPDAFGAASADLLEVVAIGIGDPSVTARVLEDAATLAEVLALRETFQDILDESGLTQGEPRPAEAPAELQASTNSSNP